MMKTSKKSLSVLYILLSLLITTPLWAQNQPTEQDELLKMIPADSLLVLRVNNLQNTISQIDQFIQGASPLPMGASMLVRMQLAELLADPALSALNMTGNFAVFLMLPSTSAQQRKGRRNHNLKKYDRPDLKNYNQKNRKSHNLINR